ncbi:Maltose/maltodextrin transport ATP-binding protein MalK [Candidatus Rhodobacter oscarellae]|uniref:Maltose/maltodextrin transport ATP-binding protein MalK n=1 Tax=Candidatus Rhodobacter oscarellae TaxID=1675527 RepID=A0A0J9E3R2_9RHOB|nr:sn-glycerol-3-phosphate ABC transporter ATP-binding protein UgpC [Candidatus Rhodobacter lobularis]KMW57352.1 Maltose/maltodextrin transport ATP-binding protein MalK [Candidatus Rhodobacter lobularis]
MASVTIEQVIKRYGDTQVMHGVDLDIQDGEFVVFVGPSGCGKSTLLRMIAGLEDISDGTIEIGGTVVNEVAPAKRGVAMVFQTYALYPHMTVYNNMAFGLKQAKMDKAEIDKRVRAAGEILHITDYLERTPKALSGGQRQRVAIGRAIVREPEVFLFDEPLSNLDAALRVQTRLEIARLHKRLGTTMIYVTHDQVEAMTLADKIVVLRDGRVEQVGAPVDLYERPKNTFVAQFIGSPKMNFFAPSALAATAPADLRGGSEDALLVGIRPEHLRVCEPSEAIVTARLDLIENLGEHVLAHMVATDGTEFIAKMETLPEGADTSAMQFTAAPERVHRFDKASGLRQ